MFKRTERLIYEYFQRNKNTQAKEVKIKLLEEQIEALDKSMRETDINIPEQRFETNWGDCGGSGGTNEGYSDRAIERIIGNMEREVYSKIELISKLEGEIRTIESVNAEFEYHFERLSDGYKQLLILKYDKKLTDEAIGFELNMSRGNINKIKRKLIMDIMNWEIVAKQ